MPSPNSLLDEWKRRLSELLLDRSEPNPLSWRQEIQTRVLRYLVSRYKESPDMEAHTRPTSPETSVPFFAKLPKTANVMKSPKEIRKLLNKIHEANSPRPSEFFDKWTPLA